MKSQYSLLIIFSCFLSFYLSGCANQQFTKQNKEVANMKKTIVNPWTWQDKYGFVQGNRVTDAKSTFYTAGIVSVDNDGILLYPNDMEKQINQIFDNMEVLLNQAKYKLSDVVRFTYYTTDVQAFIDAGQVLGIRLEKAGCRPATSLIGVKSLFHPDCVVEIEAIVVK